MAFSDPPHFAAWQHRDSRDGFEVMFVESGAEGLRVEGHVSAVEDGRAWAVHYAIVLGADWSTRRARVVGHSEAGRAERTLEADGAGRWRVDGEPASELDGCPDVDLEASAFTNALPVHRLALAPGERADAPAAWVRAAGLAVERLEQTYERVDDGGRHQRYDYAAPALEFTAPLVFDEHGFVLDYPGIAVRAA
jgi:hypothetical protein